VLVIGFGRIFVFIGYYNIAYFIKHIIAIIMS